MLRLVPTDVHAEQLDPVEGTPFVSLRRAIAKGALGAAVSGRAPATRAHRLLALDGLLHPDTRPASLAPFRAELDALVSTSGLLDAIDGALGRLLQTGARPERVALGRTRRAQLTAALLDAYARVLGGADLVDPRAVDLVPALDEDVEVTRCIDLSPAVLSLLARTHVARRRVGGSGVRIRVPSDGEDGASLAPVLDAWEQHLSGFPDAPELVFDAPSAQQRNAGGRDERPGTARVVEAPSFAAEARAIAALVLGAIADGVAVDRIAIVVDDGDRAVAEAIERALGDAGVPFSSLGRGAIAQPEVQVLLALLDMAEGELSRGALVDVLRSPGLHPGAWVDDAAEQSAVGRAAVLAHALRGLPIARDPDGARFADALVGTPWMRSAVLRIADEVRRLRAVKSRASFGAALARFIDRTRLGDPSARALHDVLRARAIASKTAAPRADLGALGALAAGARAARALRRAADDFADAARALPDPPTPVGELGRELLRALELQSIDAPGAAPRIGAVRVGPAREAVDRGLSLLVVAGLDSNAYDAPAGADAWLDDETVAALPPDARPRAPTLARAVLDAELRAAIASAGAVVLTRAVRDGDGRERGGPHPILRRAIDLGAPATVEPISPLARDASVLSPRQRALARLASGDAIPSELVARVAIERERMEYFRDAQRAAGAFSGLVEGTSVAAVAAAIGGRTASRGVAVTTAETAAACAFRVLAERVCGARPLVEAIEADSALERGNLLHEALFLAFRTQADLPDAMPADEASSRIRARLEAALLGGATGALNVEARRMCIDDAMQVVDAARATPDDLHFAMGEVKFGRPDDPLGALSASATDGTEIWFEGKIDRVDLSGDRRRARVIDYKSGRAPRARAIGETSYQLPLYALAVRRHLRVTDTTAHYLSLRRGGDVEISPREPRAQVLDADALAAAATSAADSIVRVHAGELGPRPRTPSRCAWCTSRDICRRPAVSAASSPDARNGP